MLITRPEPDAGAFAAMCAANGLSPVTAPLMDIDIDARPVDLDGVGALAFTSANGARAFAANATVRKLTVFAVGPATAGTAREEGFEDVRVAGGDVGALAQSIDDARDEIDGSVLHVAGADRAGDLIAALEARGLPARRAVLYQARAVAALPPAARAALSGAAPAEWAALFSPRTAALFVSLVRAAGLEDRLAHMRAACLSDAVAEAARGPVWKSLDIAAGRDAHGMIALMAGGGVAATPRRPRG